MDVHLEIEFKLLVSQITFEKIKQDYRQYNSVKQINTYFDSKINPLYANGLNLRIREVQQKHILCLKQKQESGLHEYELEVPNATTATFDIPEVNKLLASKQIEKPLYVRGQLTTYRTEVPFNHGVLCLDKNEYNGIVDYELEFEITKDAKLGYQEFLDFIKIYQLSYTSNCISKTQRCLQSI